jgi:hypothetical protein
MSSYTLLGKSPLLATSLADRPFDESLKLILNLVPTKMKFFPIHYFSTDDLITVRRKVSLFDPVLPEIVPKKLSQRFQHLDALECHSRPSHYLRGAEGRHFLHLFIHLSVFLSAFRIT